MAITIAIAFAPATKRMRIGASYPNADNVRSEVWITYTAAVLTKEGSSTLKEKRHLYAGPDEGATVLNGSNFDFNTRIKEMVNMRSKSCLQDVYSIWKEQFGDATVNDGPKNKRRRETMKRDTFDNDISRKRRKQNPSALADPTLHMDNDELMAKFYEFESLLSSAAYARIGAILQNNNRLTKLPPMHLLSQLRKDAIKHVTNDPQKMWTDPNWLRFINSEKQEEQKKEETFACVRLGAAFAELDRDINSIIEAVNNFLRVCEN